MHEAGEGNGSLLVDFSGDLPFQRIHWLAESNLTLV
jgi:hypothetical protein